MLKRLALTGYYGMSNYGDDLFVISSFLAAQRYWSSYEVRVLSAPVSGFDGIYAVPPLIPSRTLQYHNLVGKLSRLSNMVWNSAFFDKFVFAGGSLFSSSDLGARDLLYRLRRKGDCFSAVGVSVGPFENQSAEKKIKDQLRRFEYISVRDRVSYERVDSYGIDAKLVEAADLVGVLPLIFPVEKSHDLHQSACLKIGFSPCFLLEKPSEAQKYCDIFVRSVGRLTREAPVEVSIICLNQHYKVGDVQLCQYAQSELARLGIKSTITLYQDVGVLGAWQLISEMDAYFSARMHGAVTAYLCDVPFFLFEYHEKCSEFLDFVGKPLSERLLASSTSEDDALRVFRNVAFHRGPCEMSPAEFCRLSEKSFLESPFCAQY